MLRRVAIVATGLLLGFLAALVALATGLIVELAALDAPTSMAVLAGAATLGAHVSADTLTQAIAGLWGAALTLCLVPVALAALVGEAAGWREPVFYAGSSGALAAAAPLLARAAFAGSGSPAVSAGEGRVLLLLSFTGVASGAVYWTIAGREAGRR